MREVVIVGNGPAGISAALYTRRAGIQTTIIGKDGGALAKADRIDNYYGFPEGISGQELIENGIAQAKRLGVAIVEDEVVGIGFDGRYQVNTPSGTYPADALILATGAGRTAPNIEGLKKFEGKGVSYCAVCDGFFYRGKDVAVLGCCEYALAEAKELLPIANSVKIITNGTTPSEAIPEDIEVITQEIKEIQGDASIQGVAFADGSAIDAAGIFIAVGVAGSSDLARKLGAEINGNKIVVNEKMETALPGLYAAGDCTGGLLQIAKVVHDGAIAGTEAVKYLRKLG